MVVVHFKPFIDFHEVAVRVCKEEKHKIQSMISWADIQHIGSSAIPGSVTKGDVDLNVRVSVGKFKEAVGKLKKLYEINQPENWTPNFASFKDDTGSLPVGVQLTIIGSKYDDFVKLRDLLKSNLLLLEEYNQMKLKYEGKDMDEYRKEKADFFEKLRKLK